MCLFMSIIFLFILFSNEISFLKIIIIIIIIIIMIFTSVNHPVFTLGVLKSLNATQAQGVLDLGTKKNNLPCVIIHWLVKSSPGILFNYLIISNWWRKVDSVLGRSSRRPFSQIWIRGALKQSLKKTLEQSLEQSLKKTLKQSLKKICTIIGWCQQQRSDWLNMQQKWSRIF